MAAYFPVSPFTWPVGLNAFDWLLIIFLVWSVVLAFSRGLIRELFGFAGAILGLLLAAWNYRSFAGWMCRWIDSSTAADVAAFVIIDVAVMIACTLLGRLVRGTAHTIGLGFLDRLAGAVFGALRGVLITVAILMVMTAFLPPQAMIANSRVGPYFLAAAREVCFVVPQVLQKRITGGITSVKHIATR